jgi:two-component system C4-dicarboxylate transport response regulator DctD
VLQERRLERLGGNEGVALDCRVVAASKADLLQLSAQGLFREDLYYRIGVVTIDLPRLRDRREDIPLLLAHFVQEAAVRYQRPLPQWSAQDMAAWQAADWPGNVRELRNFAERLTLGLAPTLAPPAPSAPASASISAPLAAIPGAAPDASSLPQQVDNFERDLIVQALSAADGNVALAADNLSVPRKTLYDKLKKYQISTGKK